MAYDFSNIKKIILPNEIELSKITDAKGNIIWQKIYIWKKYTVVTNTTIGSPYKQILVAEKKDQEGLPREMKIVSGGSYSFSSSSGRFTLSSTNTLNSSYDFGKFYGETVRYLCSNPYNGDVTATSGYELYKIIDSGIIRVVNAQGYGQLTGFMNYEKYTREGTEKTTESKGTYISDVSSTNSSTYPTNGKHTDGYWYVIQ